MADSIKYTFTFKQRIIFMEMYSLSRTVDIICSKINYCTNFLFSNSSNASCENVTRNRILFPLQLQLILSVKPRFGYKTRNSDKTLNLKVKHLKTCNQR